MKQGNQEDERLPVSSAVPEARQETFLLGSELLSPFGRLGPCRIGFRVVFSNRVAAPWRGHAGRVCVIVWP